MAMLSPKARRFVAIAIDGCGDDRAKAIWSAVDKDIAGDLPDAAARVALAALQRLEGRVRDRLQSSAMGEDEAADLSNDLGLICAIESDLRRQVGERAA
jgi:hypothetical protein